MPMFRLIVACSLPAGLAAAPFISGDARRGEELFRRESCIECHSINGKGGKVGPDLGKHVGRDYTPAVMASVMWNHAPAMWSAMKTRGIRRATLSQDSAADLFAYFYSVRYFELPGDAARGKQLFEIKHCSECHGLTQSPAQGGTPVARWRNVGYPIALANQMWNHASQMKELFARKKVKWSELTPQELTDIQVYVQNLPALRGQQPGLILPAGENGQALFQSKGCVKCHDGARMLEGRLKRKTLTGIAVEMWNHAPRMAGKAPALELDEMRQILSYLWAGQFFAEEGSPGRGQRVFEEKKCVRCHRGGGAPNLAAKKGQFSPIFMVAALWEHGPRMLDEMQAKNVTWPRFSGTQMADLIAYLNAGK